MLNANGPGFKGLYAGDSVEFRTAGGPGIAGGVITRTARVLPLLVFTDHVQVAYGSCGYTVDTSNFVRLVRRGKRHIAADTERFLDLDHDLGALTQRQQDEHAALRRLVRPVHCPRCAAERGVAIPKECTHAR